MDEEDSDVSSGELSDDARQRFHQKKAIRQRDEKYASNFPQISNEFLVGLRQETFLTDVTFKVDGKEFPAHKIVLSCRSEVFHSMFASSMSEAEANSVIEIEDADSESFKRFLDVMYTCETSAVKENPVPIFTIAHKYSVKWLARECERIMVDTVNWDTFDQYWKVAVLYEPYGLKETLVNFLRVNYFQMLTRHWDEFSKNIEAFTELISMIGESQEMIRILVTDALCSRSSFSLSLNYFYKSYMNARGEKSILPYEKKGIVLRVKLKTRFARKFPTQHDSPILKCSLNSIDHTFARDFLEFPEDGVPLMVCVSLFHNGKRILAKELYVTFFHHDDVITIFSVHLGRRNLQELEVQIGVSYVYMDCRPNFNAGQLEEFQKFFCIGNRLHFAHPPKCLEEQDSVNPRSSAMEKAISRLIQLCSAEEGEEEEESEKRQLLQFVKFNSWLSVHSGSLKTAPNVMRDLLLTMLSDCFHPYVAEEPVIAPGQRSTRHRV